MRDVPLGFVLTLATAMADATMDAMIREPAEADVYGDAAFEAIWRVLRRLLSPGRRLISTKTAKDHQSRAPRPTPSSAQAWIITGPTSGIGRRAALELAKHGAVILVGRNLNKLSELKADINALPGGHAVSVVGDFSDIRSVRRAAAKIIALDLPIARPGEQCRHHARLGRSKRPRVGPRLRDQPPRAVCVHGGAHPTPARRHEHRVHLLRR